MAKEQSLDQLIQRNLDQLPLHALHWEVREIHAPIHPKILAKNHNGIIYKDLMYKPISTFFKISLNARK